MRTASGRRIVQAFEEADRDPDRIDEGALDFVIVGGGPTGVEVAGALSEMINTTMLHEFPALAPRARVHIVNHGNALLAMFADKGHAYTARVLEKDNVDLRLGTGVTEIGPGHVTLSDGSTIKTRCVVWGGGLMAAPIAAASGLPQGRGGRIDVAPDFTVAGFPGVLVDRRHREHPGEGRQDLPAARVGRPPERQRGREDDPRRSPGPAAQALLLFRQGNDGDDRARRRDRPGRRASSCTARSPSRPGSASTPR